ncbi:MAG: hypothetical protein QM538_06150 [Methylacidiphilales bacterium]|nr:hypothetical protein [Candidatus Methylacidiphilales bacterium]
MNKIKNRIAMLLLLSFVGVSQAEDNAGTIYGAINQAYLSIENGKHKVEAVGNNHAYSTRIGYKGALGNINSLAVGFQIEAGLQTISLRDVTFLKGDNYAAYNGGTTSTAKDGDGLINIRTLEVTIGGEFGIVTIGQGSLANDGADESDITGTKDIVTSKFIESWGERNIFFDSKLYVDGNIDKRGPTVGEIFNNFDSSRYARIRYDSGTDDVIFTVSYSPSSNCSNTRLDCTNSSEDTGASSSITEIKLTAKLTNLLTTVGYTVQNPNKLKNKRNGITHFSISGGDSGFGIMYSNSHQNYLDRKTVNFQYLKVTFTEDVHTFNIDYAQVADVQFTDPIDSKKKYLQGNSIGVMFGQYLKDYKLNIYYGYRTFSATFKGAQAFNEVEGYIVGALIKF